MSEKFKNEPKSQTDSDRKQCVNEKEEEGINLEDWSFIQEEPRIEIGTDEQKQGNVYNSNELFQSLLQLKKEVKLKGRKESNQNVEKHFWIPRGDITKFIDRYRKKSGTLSYPKILNKPRERFREIFKIILNVSDKKLNLESYPIFSEDIVQFMNLKLQENYKAAFKIPHPNSKEMVSYRVIFIKNLTKASTVLHLINLSIFNEHEKGKNTREHIEKFLDFIKDLWKTVEIGEDFKLINHHEFADKLNKILKFKTERNTPLNGNPGTNMKYALDIFYYFQKKQGDHLPEIPSEYHRAMCEIISKMIIYSNYQTISKRIRRTSSAFLEKDAM